MPPGSNRVVVRESVTPLGGPRIVLPERLAGKDHVRRLGSDMAEGAVTLAKGTVLGPRQLVVAAASRATSLSVYRRPRVHCIAIGDELARPGVETGPASGSIPDSLTQAVLLLARQWGAKPCGGTVVCDNIDDIRIAAMRAREQADIIVLIGGASHGDRDFSKPALLPLGLQIVFADIAMKPGKPAWFGKLDGCEVLGLPGNPTAAMTVARLFLAPLLTGLGGRGCRAGLAWKSAPIASDAPAGNREAFLCATWAGEEVSIVKRQSASSQALLACADLLVRLPVGERPHPRGSLLSYLPF